jgi:hypothetical protein
VVSIDGNSDVTIDCTSTTLPSGTFPLTVEAVAVSDTWDFTVAYLTGAAVNCDKCFKLERPVSASDVTTAYNGANGVEVDICGTSGGDDISPLATRISSMESTQGVVTTAVANDISTFQTKFNEMYGYQNTEAPYVRSTINEANAGWQDFTEDNTNLFDMTYLENGNGQQFVFTNNEYNNRACGESTSDTTNYVTFANVRNEQGVNVRRLQCVMRDSRWAL